MPSEYKLLSALGNNVLPASIFPRCHGPFPAVLFRFHLRKRRGFPAPPKKSRKLRKLPVLSNPLQCTQPPKVALLWRQ